jgi:hypothetical protein
VGNDVLKESWLTLQVLVVDLDQGVFGQALLAGVSSVNGANTVPTFVIAANGTTIQDAIDAVWRADYWAAVIAQPGYSLVGIALSRDHKNQILMIGSQQLDYIPVKCRDVQC